MLDNTKVRIRGGEFDEAVLAVSGKPLIADASGALFWPGESLLIVADMHLEKGSAAAVRGQLLPPYDTAETLTKLEASIERFQPERIALLGDSFHDAGAIDRLHPDDLEWLYNLQEGRDWIWITGNHDPVIPEELTGKVVDHLEVSGVTLRHQPRPGPVTHEIAGHLHPAAKLALEGAVLRRPCFVGNGRRLIVPAFGAYTGGLNVLDPAFDGLFGDSGLKLWVLGSEGVYPVAARGLKAD